MDDKQLLDAIRQIVRDEARQIVREELKPVKADLSILHADNESTHRRLDKVEGNQEYGLKWLDRVEERLNPVADYIETMYLNAEK